MAKKKTDYLAEAKELDLDVTDKNTVAEITAAIEKAQSGSPKEESTEPEFKKAGKRSKKAIEEAEAEAERLAKKEAGDTTPESGEEEAKKKGPKPKTRPIAERRGKKYREAFKKVDKSTVYELPEAVALAQDTSTTSFDSSVELHVRLNVDPKKSDQNIRGNLVLPHGTGKTVRVAVMADESEQKEAKEAGADIADSQTLMNQLQKEDINFDVLIATPKQMSQLGKYAKMLGPRGLMPNPKSGTVTTDVAKAVREAKAGRVEFRVDRYGIVHVAVGKVSFKANQLQENIEALIKAIREARPPSVKSEFVRSAVVTTSMGPGIKLKV